MNFANLLTTDPAARRRFAREALQDQTDAQAAEVRARIANCRSALAEAFARTEAALEYVDGAELEGFVAEYGQRGARFLIERLEEMSAHLRRLERHVAANRVYGPG